MADKTYFAEKGLQLEIKTGVDAIKTAVDAGTIGKTPRRQIFFENGTWTAPIGVTRVFVTGGGGGGGGCCALTPASISNGGSGGVTSFGTLISLSGGGGGSGVVQSSIVSSPNIGGLAGGSGGSDGEGMTPYSTNYNKGGKGGSSGPHEGTFGLCAVTNATNVFGYKADNCAGGGGMSNPNGSNGTFAGGGGGGAYVENHPLNVVPGTSYSIVIGLGGAGGNYQSSIRASDGGDGYLIVEWWE